MRDWRPAAAIALLFLPVAVGILATRTSLLATPFTLAWEKSQALDPLAAATLSGYFTHYDSDIERWAYWAMLLLLTIATFGAVYGMLRRRRQTGPFLLITAAALFWSFGTHGPASIFAWTVTHVPESALFRELYILIGIVCVGYTALLAIASSAYRPLGFVMLATALVLPASWSIKPPMTFTTNDAAIPHTHIDAPFGTRYLLLPATSPIKFGEAGSGIDPDLCPSTNGADPINEYDARYPVSSAIGRFYRSGSLADFAALGVVRIYDRPWFETDRSIGQQLAFPAAANFFSRRTSTTVLHAGSELGLSPVARVGSLVNVAGAGNVLMSDALDAKGAGVPPAWGDLEKPVPVQAANQYVRAADGWVDARFGFMQEPDIAQPYGGALTTNPDAVLELAAGRYVLAYVRGQLTDERGGLVMAAAGGYRWIEVPPGVRGVRCRGLCAIAAQADSPIGVELNPRYSPQADLTFSRPISWLVLARLPAVAAPSTLRYNVSYDRSWLAIEEGTVLPHVRIDGTTNGWIVARSDRARRVIIVEAAALAVMLSELLAALGLAALLCKPMFLYGNRIRHKAEAVLAALDRSAKPG